MIASASRQKNLENLVAEGPTYAQARLWLGISCVGATTLLASCLIFFGVTQTIFSQSVIWSVRDIVELFCWFSAWILFLIPFDFLGGYLLSRLFDRPQFQSTLKRWLGGVLLQGLIFLMTATAILAVGRMFDVIGVLVLLMLIQLFYISFRLQISELFGTQLTPLAEQTLRAVRGQLEVWGYNSPDILVAEHEDAGFTGGVCGPPGRETIIIPNKWCQQLGLMELSSILAHRIEACKSGGYARGMLIASTWNLVGFLVAVNLPSSGVQSVAGLVTTCLWLTLWTFLGLLILPTFSRRSTYSLDHRVVQQGVPKNLLRKSLSQVQRMQDETNPRSRAVESVFYPVPNLQHRLEHEGTDSQTGAWNVTRNMLFLSWTATGLLSRAVHCNCGRPELWVFLPTD